MVETITTAPDALTALRPHVDREKKVDIRDILKEVFPDGDIFGKSVLTQDQVLAVSVAWTFAEMQEKRGHVKGAQAIKDLVRTLLKTQVSFGGWGRKDMRTIFAAMVQSPEFDENQNRVTGLFKKLFRRGSADL